jgi:SAM-dependent methyltransferase
MDPRPEPVILDSVDDMIHRATSVLAGTQLDLFTPLRDGPLRAAQIAQSLGVDATRLRPLLYALVVVGLLREEDGRFANTAEADTYLVRGRPGYQGHRAKYWSPAWGASLLIAESIRTGKPQAEHDYATMPEEELEDFLQGLYPWSFEAGTWLAQNYDFASCQTVLDAGGGSGGLATALAGALPHLHVMVVDLPSVIPITRRFVERAGATGRVWAEAVDLVHEPLAGSFDAAVMRAFVQVMSLEEAHQALENIHQALTPGSTIYIWDRPLDDSRLTPEDLVAFNSVFVAIYERGQKYTVQEYRELLAGTGFVDFALHDDRIITARKPAAA